MEILIMHQTVAEHDAIGNDIEMMCKILSCYGDCKIYAENKFRPRLSYIDLGEVERIIQTPDTLVIYHHSVFWNEGEEILKRCRCKTIFRYHNITPTVFFAPYNDFHREQCSKGREQTERLAKRFSDACWLLDSAYNGKDLPLVPEDRKAVCAPFHKIESWASATPREDILENLLYSDDLELLFVSRVAPNKGHFFLLDMLYLYRKYFDRRVKLHIIGKFDDSLQVYNELIKSRIKQLALTESVEFIGEVDDTLLVSYYLGCDFFVCTSDHEGFGVPLVEAQYFKLPIIAKDTSAVAETLGKGQIVLGEDPREFAVALNTLRNNKVYYRALQENGRRNYETRFTDEILRENLLLALKKFQVLDMQGA